MAQTDSPTDPTDESPSPTNHDAVLATVDGPTVTATVGEHRGPLTADRPTLRVPEHVGSFTHRPVPNDATTTWQAIHGPHDPDYSTDDPDPDNWPHFTTRVKITCETCAGWGVSRSVHCVGWSTTLFAGTATSGPTEHLETIETVVDGLPDRETALAFAVRVMRAESPTDDPVPAAAAPHRAEGYCEKYDHATTTDNEGVDA